jgi:hypothetical protein
MPRHAVSRAAAHLLLAASAVLAGGCGDSTEPPTSQPPARPLAARLFVVAGDGQHGVAGQLLPAPVVVQVLDSTLQPLPKQTLSFQVLSGGGSVSSDTAVTDGSGLVTVSWTLGPTPHTTQALFVRLVAQSPGGHLLYATLTATAENPATGVTFDRVYAGGSQSCALTTDGAAYCWGYYALGTGHSDAATVPTGVSGGLRFARLALGETHTCGLTLAGAAYCWGSGDFGELGNGTTGDALVPEAVSGELVFQDIAAGAEHTCALTPAGEAYCWGMNTHGELGDGTTTDRLVPTPVAGGLTFSEIAPSFYYTCALTVAGRAYCWGQGRLGFGPDPALTPTPVPGDLVFTSISTGDDHACGLVAGGAAYCWGGNLGGQFGDGSRTSSGVPVPAGGGHTFRSISLGQDHTCAITTDAQAMCWGWDYTDVGSGYFIHSLVPVPLSSGLRFASLEEGYDHGCGMTTGQVAYCWFSGGMLGDGTYDDSSVPVKVR